MKTYVSSNGITMLKGHKMNWEYSSLNADGTGPMVLGYSVGNMSEMWVVNYHTTEKEVRIANMRESSNDVFVFHVNNLDEAEFIALSFTKGMKQEVMPLYKK